MGKSDSSIRLASRCGGEEKKAVPHKLLSDAGDNTNPSPVTWGGGNVVRKDVTKV